jgi:hypothetical protein
VSLTPQQARVLCALRFRGAVGISQVDFLLPDVVDGGKPITRVPARIKELKEAGYTIRDAGRRDRCKVFRLFEPLHEPLQLPEPPRDDRLFPPPPRLAVFDTEDAA